MWALGQWKMPVLRVRRSRLRDPKYIPLIQQKLNSARHCLINSISEHCRPSFCPSGVTFYWWIGRGRQNPPALAALTALEKSSSCCSGVWLPSLEDTVAVTASGTILTSVSNSRAVCEALHGLPRPSVPDTCFRITTST